MATGRHAAPDLGASQTAVVLPTPAPGKAAALLRMKLVATSLLVLAAAGYVLCETLTDGNGVWGYLTAAAEASMVGGIADWFAVTALFRRPLRLPIPHTAIIPRKKDQIGEALADFVGQYFLTPEIIQERVASAAIPQRIGTWLCHPDNARQIADELSRAVGGLAAVLHDDELRNTVASIADKRLRDIDAAPLLAQVIDGLCDSGQHQAMLTTALRGTKRFLDNNKETFRDRLGDESPGWVPDWVDDRIFAKGFDAVQALLADVIDTDGGGSEEHELRRTYDAQLRAFAERLRTDPEQAGRVEEAKLQLLEHPKVREWLGTLWARIKDFILNGAADPESHLRRALESLTIRAGEVLRDDPRIGSKVDEALQRLTGHVVTNYSDDLAAVISTTVARWDTAETSRRLELQIGRDLQFIRINGTVVGALAGLAIYALTQVF
ncbi:MAG TPA: DUF445 domain-containing protein [Jatrophihabitans sp.]|jgi:uncharacterized membrane-anchored protein YjiN (DUF445 family)